MNPSQPGTVRPAPAPVSVAALAAALDEFEDTPNYDLDLAVATAVEVERAASELGDVALGMRARLIQANGATHGGQPVAAMRTLWEVNAWAGAHDYRPLQARSHILLAHTFHLLGDDATCLEHTIRALELLDNGTPPRTRAYYLVKLADALAWSGSVEAARERFSQATDLAASIGEIDIQRMAWNNLACTEHFAGFPERAWAAAERMLALVAALRRAPDTNELDTIACIQITLGRYADAERSAQRSIAEYDVAVAAEADGLPIYLHTLAVAQRHLGALDRAWQSLAASRALSEERGLAEMLVRVREEEAELHAAAGEFEQAFEAYKSFHTAAESLRRAQHEARARTRQAMFETAEARQQAEAFREEARRDPLTGLRNRRFVDERLPLLIGETTGGAPLAVALVDLDHFKRINDTLSHDVGDQVLVAVAGLLRAAVPEPGFVARMGGEEFLIVLPGTDLAAALEHLDGVRRAVSAHHWQPVTGRLPVTVSVGVTSTESFEGATQSALLAVADRHLYTAKHSGRDKVAAGPARHHRD